MEPPSMGVLIACVPSLVNTNASCTKNGAQRMRKNHGSVQTQAAQSVTRLAAGYANTCTRYYPIPPYVKFAYQVSLLYIVLLFVSEKM